MFGTLLIYKAVCLVHFDLLFSYPFITYDGYQWVYDGLLYIGYALDFVYRNPALPIIIGFMSALELERFLPVLLCGLLFLYFTFLYFLLKAKFKDSLVSITLIFFFFNFSIQTFFDFILADQWALTLLLISMYFLFKIRKHPKYLLPTVIFYSISFQFQYAIAFLSVAYITFFFTELYNSKNPEFKKYIVVSIAAGLLIISPNFIYKYVKFGNPLYSHVTHFPLLHLHFFGSLYYTVAFLSFFGIPAGLIIVYGFFKSIHLKGDWLFIHLAALSYFVFWMLFYSWLDNRFLLYFIPFFPFYFAYGLEKSGLTELLNLENKTFIHKIVIAFCFFLALSLSMYNKLSPFNVSSLPITPQEELVFTGERFTKWDSNIILNLQNLRIRSYEDEYPGLNFLLYYSKYKSKKKQMLFSVAKMEYEDLKNFRKVIPKEKLGLVQIADCTGDQGHEQRMRKRFTLRSDLLNCGSNADYYIFDKEPAKDMEVLFLGSRLVFAKKGK